MIARLTAARRALRDDWTQFRLLSRDGVRQLVDTALFSRDADPMEFALWMVALVATPPAFLAARQIFLYTSLVNAPVPVVEQFALMHRLFFVVYGMLAAALLAALTWDSLFPDGRDQEIVGVLPVRPQTVAAARLAAALGLGAGFAAAVNGPAALVYSAVSSGHPALPNLVVQFAAQFTATMLGSMAVFCTLLALRGLAAVVFGARAGEWLGIVLQLAAVILLVEVFFFLPGVLETLVRAVVNGDSRAAAFPPVWFAAINEWMAGSSHAAAMPNPARALLVFAVAAIATVPIYLLPARWLGRRALESRRRDRGPSPITIASRASGLLTRSTRVRAIVAFAVASLCRSRRHLLVLATWVGLALAVAVASVILLEVRGFTRITVPGSWYLTFPMIFIFFLTIGLRAAFRLPTEIEANWPFRIAPPSLQDSIGAAAIVMVGFALLPAVLLFVAGTAPLWPLRDVALGVLLLAVAGVALIECVLRQWTKVPFASAHAPSPEMLKGWWPVYLTAMYLYAFKLADWQYAALRSRTALLLYISTLSLGVLVLRVIRRRSPRSLGPEFDAPAEHSVERLNLSEALN